MTFHILSRRCLLSLSFFGPLQASHIAERHLSVLHLPPIGQALRAIRAATDMSVRVRGIHWMSILDTSTTEERCH